MARRVSKTRELVNELKDLMLREGTELSEKGFFQRAMVVISSFGGSVDKNTEQLARIKTIIEELDEEV